MKTFDMKERNNPAVKETPKPITINQKFKKLDSVTVGDILYVTNKYLATYYKLSPWTAQKQLNHINEVFAFDAIKIGHNIFYNFEEGLS